MAQHRPPRRWPHRLIALAATVGAVAACAPGPTPPPPQTRSSTAASPVRAPNSTSTAAAVPVVRDHPVATSGCGLAPFTPAGTTEAASVAANPHYARGLTRRSYRLHLPVGYDSRRPTPLLLVFHGYGSDGTAAETLGFSAVADRRGVIVAYPEGVRDDSGAQFWAELGPFDFLVDDVLFVSDLLDQLQAQLCVDATHIAVSGFSNGGSLIALLACRLASRIAAFAPLSGAYYRIPDGCEPSRPTALLEVHGDADPLALYFGTDPKTDILRFPIPAVADWLTGIAAADGCTPGPSSTLALRGALNESWTCPPPGALRHLRLLGVGHTFPARIGDRDGADVVWDFLAAHPLDVVAVAQAKAADARRLR